jgi:hypothetical protein
MQPVTLASIILCFGVLFLRYKKQAATAQRSTTKQKFKMGKLLLSGLLALLAVGFALQRLNHNIDGEHPEPSMLEQIVTFFK